MVPSKTRLASRGASNAVVAVSMRVGLILNFVGLNAVAMLFWSAVINKVLASPLIVLVVLLTSDPTVVGKRVNPPLLRCSAGRRPSS